jgi:hypothetical protein
MDISKALPGTITLEYQDEEWAQTIDYEHIPFRCRKCHEHGHLFRDFPLNAPPSQLRKRSQRMASHRFRLAGSRRRRKQLPTIIRKNPNTNSFDALTNLPEAEEVENPHKALEAEGISDKEN